MAKKNLSTIRALIRQKLNDEFQAGIDFEWLDDELDLLIGDCLIEISGYSPYQVKETVPTVADSKDLDISENADGDPIEDRLWVYAVEYEVDKDPKQMHNCTLFGNTLTMEIDSVPSASDEDVYVYCAKVHQLTDATSTLNPALERLLVLGVAGQAAINKAQKLIGKVNIGGGRTPADMHTWGADQRSLYRAGLNRAAITKESKFYPTS